MIGGIDSAQDLTIGPQHDQPGINRTDGVKSIGEMRVGREAILGHELPQRFAKNPLWRLARAKKSLVGNHEQAVRIPMQAEETAGRKLLGGIFELRAAFG